MLDSTKCFNIERHLNELWYMSIKKFFAVKKKTRNSYRHECGRTSRIYEVKKAKSRQIRTPTPRLVRKKK